MELARYVEALQSDLAGIAAVGDEQTAEAAGRLIEAIRASAGLRLLDVLTDAALEVSGQLPSGHVEVRLTGQDPALVYVEEESEAAPVAPGEEGTTARISLRLPEGLKASIDAAAAREGVSVNTWLVRALTRSLAGGTSRPGKRLTGFAKS